MTGLALGPGQGHWQLEPEAPDPLDQHTSESESRRLAAWQSWPPQPEAAQLAWLFTT